MKAYEILRLLMKTTLELAEKSKASKIFCMLKLMLQVIASNSNSIQFSIFKRFSPSFLDLHKFPDDISNILM